MDASRYIKRDMEPDRRLLVTSDIHGHLSNLKGVLEKAHFSDEDFLVIIGDVVEKGPESLETLKYIIQLFKKGNVAVLRGNVDDWFLYNFFSINKENFNNFWLFLQDRRGWCSNFFDEMSMEVGVYCEKPEDVPGAKEAILERFADELSFLQDLPIIFEIQNYVFVHGGLREKNICDNLKRNHYELEKYDNFMSTNLCFEKWVTVGHWPVSFYGDGILQCNPVIDESKKIVSIDGGCGIKEDGQLNLISISGAVSDAAGIVTYSCDGLPLYRAKTGQKASDKPFSIRWPDNAVKITEVKGDLTLISHVGTDRKMWIPSDYIYGENRCLDCTDYMLPVNSGDILSLVKTTSNGSLVKKNGVIGWYYGDMEKL